MSKPFSPPYEQVLGSLTQSCGTTAEKRVFLYRVFLYAEPHLDKGLFSFRAAPAVYVFLLLSTI
jgi:hypothetical protein